MELVDVPVTRIDRDAWPERVMLAEPEEVFEGRCEKDWVGLPVDVLEEPVERVGLGLADDVLDPTELVVCVLDEVTVRVAVAVDVCVAELRLVAVAAELAEEVFEAAPVTVVTQVGLMDFVDVELGEGSHVPASERVDVVVFVDVFDCVDVDVGTRPPARRERSSNMGLVFQGLVATDPIDASSKSQRIFSTTAVYFKKFRCA